MSKVFQQNKTNVLILKMLKKTLTSKKNFLKLKVRMHLSPLSFDLSSGVSGLCLPDES